MNVRECMCKKPEFIPPETTLLELAQKFRDNDCGFFPVGENDRLIGVCTDRDLVVRGIAEGWDLSSTTVRDVMSPTVLYIYEDQPIEEAAESMCLQQIRRLIVLNRDKRMTGILALSDIAEGSGDDKLCGHIIEEVTELRRAA